MKETGKFFDSGKESQTSSTEKDNDILKSIHEGALSHKQRLLEEALDRAPGGAKFNLSSLKNEIRLKSMRDHGDSASSCDSDWQLTEGCTRTSRC